MDWNELQSLTWPGYARKNGGKGIRNRVLVIYTVKCAEFVAQQIVAKRSGISPSVWRITNKAGWEDLRQMAGKVLSNDSDNEKR